MAEGPQTDAQIDELFAAMHEASRNVAAPSARQRIEHLKALRAGLRKHGKSLIGAVFKDFGGRAPRETLFAELVPLGSSISHAIQHLPTWMSPEPRFANWTFIPSNARIHYQPKGVVLIIAPWNYPLLLTLNPLIEALAAGNRVILKPSELAPATARALAAMISDIFDNTHVRVVNGDAEVASRLTTLPFDHLLFTGSTRVGKLVMQAASSNLTPVTLELGGKSPALIHESFNLETAVERIAFGKLLNAGQTCIAPDYALVPRNQIREFARLYKETVTRFYPKLVGNADYTAIVNAQHYERLNGLLDDAKSRGAEIVTIDPANEMPADKRRKLAPALVLGANDDMKVMQEEIFGPILPVLGYDALDEAIAFINARPRPLALYYFDHSRKRIAQVMEETVSGGVTVNDTLTHLAQNNLPFGGIGPSGMGSYHGPEGFKTFSHAKPVFHQSRLRALDLLMPPWGKRFDRIMKRLVG